jgi:4'-phosphopantetheinyl transferase
MLGRMLMRPVLAEDEVHVWWLAGPTRGADSDLLDHEERLQWRSFARPDLAEAYLRSHAALRLVLASYLGVSAREVQYERDRCATCGRWHGKPRLARRHTTSVSFSFSRSAAVAVAAIARTEVGVDLERVDDSVDLEPLLTVGCSERERRDILLRRPDRRIEAFFGWWTRKEAVAKLEGEGLTAFDRFEVDPPPGPGTIRTLGTHGFTGNVLVRDLELEAGYAGAVALRGTACSVRLFTLP